MLGEDGLGREDIDSLLKIKPSTFYFTYMYILLKKRLPARLQVIQERPQTRPGCLFLLRTPTGRWGCVRFWTVSCLRNNDETLTT